jgi:hypothetical protein
MNTISGNIQRTWPVMTRDLPFCPFIWHQDTLELIIIIIIIIIINSSSSQYVSLPCEPRGEESGKFSVTRSCASYYMFSEYISFWYYIIISSRI